MSGVTQQIDALRAERIKAIGDRANALRRNGFYTVDEVKELAGYVKQGAALLWEIELMLTTAEEMHREATQRRATQ